MTVAELIRLLADMPPDAEVRMEVATKACSIVHSIDYNWDGEQSWITLNDYPGTINERRQYTGPKYCDENIDSGHSSSSGLNSL